MTDSIHGFATEWQMLSMTLGLLTLGLAVLLPD